MARSIKAGRKTREWLKAKPKLIEIYKEKGIIKCEISNSSFALSFHHIDKRSSLKAVHTFEGTRLLNQEWHAFCEYNKEANELLRKKPRGFKKNYYRMFKEMRNEKQKRIKKADWQRPHRCVHCGAITSMMICHHCGKISIKQKGGT